MRICILCGSMVEPSRPGPVRGFERGVCGACLLDRIRAQVRRDLDGIARFSGEINLRPAPKLRAQIDT